MPYHNLEELPASVRNSLPEHAQEIYLAAFNHAWDAYREQDERRAGATHEATAHKVAWSAVRQLYAKSNDGRWLRKH